MKYQFQVDNRAAAPLRDKWEDAAQDAVSDGYAVWVGGTSIKTINGATIARIEADGR